jgi:CheY-like chemotaxis protein
MMVASERAILVVDDEEGMRDWMAEILQGCGHRVFTAKDGLEARKFAARHPFDLMITDISMPNEEGLGIIRSLRKAHPGLKIIAISGSYAEALSDAKLLGANAALAKPFTAEMLLKCMGELFYVPSSNKVA